MPTVILATIPGFSDVADAVLAADRNALGIHLNRINMNAAFGMVRMEVFTGTYKHGDTVTLPVSEVDGYAYSRNELLYIWAPQNTGDSSTGFATYIPPWSMWYCIFNVDALGKVTSAVGYRGNDDHKDRQAQTNDGLLQVWTIAQRQPGLLLASIPAFNKLAQSLFATDKALVTSMLTKMSNNAKFGVVGQEVIYMGEFAHGATVPLPVSPVDAYAYSIGEVAYQTAWRWLSDDNGSVPIATALDKGQPQSFACAVNGSTRAVTVTIIYELNGVHTQHNGRIAVFAFCQRALGVGLDEVATNFDEIDQDTFMPGETLRASTMAQLNRNVTESVVTPEFFGPVEYQNGNTVPVPTSAADGYVYDRTELAYIWNWSHTDSAVHADDRMDLFRGGVDSSGNVTVNCYRFGQGNLAMDTVGKLNVIVVGKRKLLAFHTPIVPVVPPVTPGANDPASAKTQTLTAQTLVSPSTTANAAFHLTVFSWSSAFVDATYTVNLTDNTDGYASVYSQTATTITIKLQNTGSGYMASGTVDLVGIHA